MLTTHVLVIIKILCGYTNLLILFSFDHVIFSCAFNARAFRSSTSLSPESIVDTSVPDTKFLMFTNSLSLFFRVLAEILPSSLVLLTLVILVNNRGCMKIQ